MAEKSSKNSKICDISIPTFNTKINKIELELDLVEDNAVCLDNFFLGEDDLDKLTNIKSIDNKIQ